MHFFESPLRRNGKILDDFWQKNSEIFKVKIYLRFDPRAPGCPEYRNPPQIFLGSKILGLQGDNWQSLE